MKKVLIFLTGIIVGISSAVFATYKINSSDVGFTPTNESWKVDNVGSAINDLYTNQNDKISNLQNQISQINSGNCVSGSFVCTTCTTTEGQKIVDFEPSTFLLYSVTSDMVFYYNSKINSTKWKYYGSTPSYEFKDYSTRIKFNDSLVFYGANSTNINTTFYYMACK